MEKNLFIDQLEKGLEEMGLRPLSTKYLERLFLFQQILSKWNQKINLTAHRDSKVSLEKNFLDCMTLLPHLSLSEEVLDIGSGAGFPGLVIKICVPEKKMTLAEADQKKIAFLSTVIRDLSLQSVQIANTHLDQDKATGMGWKDKFDTIVSRATIPLEKILALIAHNLKIGGKFLGMGSQREKFFLEEAMGGHFFKIEREVPYQLPFSKMPRKIIVFEKI